MTTERTGHATKAQNLLAAAKENPADSSVYIDPWLLRAQVHATLALAEQQRIANIIALHRHEVKYDIGGWNRLYFDAVDGPELNDNIREGLGL